MSGVIDNLICTLYFSGRVNFYNNIFQYVAFFIFLTFKQQKISTQQKPKLNIKKWKFCAGIFRNSFWFFVFFKNLSIALIVMNFLFSLYCIQKSHNNRSVTSLTTSRPSAASTWWVSFHGKLWVMCDCLGGMIGMSWEAGVCPKNVYIVKHLKTIFWTNLKRNCKNIETK